MSEDATRPRILIVEDDAKLAALIGEYLTDSGFEVQLEGRGDRAVDRILGWRPDVVILDLMLPGMDGLSVCREVRDRYDGAILMLTARGDDADEVVGIEMGADDFMAKPVRPRVLLARIHNLLRRVVARPEPDSADGGPQHIALGRLRIDAGSRTVTLDGAPVDMTTAEFDLLWLLAMNAGEVLNRDVIYRELRGIEYDGLDRSVDLRVTRLRRRLGDDARTPHLLKSVRGVGYMLVRSL